MASLPGKFHLHFLAFFSLALLIDAGSSLERSDSDALALFKRDLGYNTRPNISGTPCNAAGIFCKTRISGESPVLRVTRIVLQSQRLNGFLSPSIGRLLELKELSLPNNHLVHQIPSQIVDCRRLEVLNLRDNRFSGKIPSELSSLVRLRFLDLSSNRFSGDMSFLKYFPNLENLSLADNLFTGKIQKSLPSFRNLRFLNLSGNSYLQGLAPASMKLVDVSCLTTKNNLPKRYIFAENSTRNHRSVAIAPSNSNPSNVDPSIFSSPSHKNQNIDRKLRDWIFGFLAGLFAGLTSGYILLVLFKLLLNCIREKGKDSGPAIFCPWITKAEDLAFLEKDEELSFLEMIGRGASGEVYKAELPGSNGKFIAVKIIKQPRIDLAELVEEDSKLLTRKMRQLRSQIRAFGQIWHRNILPLLAHVPRPDCHYLVFDYMKNGSLLDVLNQVSEGNRELDWLVRHRIAQGIVAGLEHLHMHHRTRIIHRDLKLANIILDDDMEARITDFGLAKAIPNANTHMTTSNVVGTVGYIAPEYQQTFKFSEKSDIYSFGVILAVLVMDKQPFDDFFSHTDMSLVGWLRNVMTSENPSRATSDKLMGNGFEKQMVLVLKIACFCTLENPRERPNSKEVRCMLSQIEHQTPQVKQWMKILEYKCKRNKRFGRGH